MASVNLWELITTVASNPLLSNNDKCQDIQNACASARSFGTELRLEVADGNWVVEVFDHESYSEIVSVKISPNGNIAITRSRTVNDMYETRTVQF